MPQVEFSGSITVVENIDDARAAVAELSGCGIVGFDTETRPSFKKGCVNRPALLQLSTHDRAYLFRINRIGLPDFVLSFLSDSSIVKVGLSIKDDFSSLRRCCNVEPAGFVELQEVAGRFGIEERGLQRMYALLFGMKISKSQQLSNWENDKLTDGQCQYAAIDAWACLVLYEYMEKLRRSGDYQIVRKDAEDSNTEEG